MAKLIWALLPVGVGIFYVMFLYEAPVLPKLDAEEWWGPAVLKGKQDTSVKPFAIKFSEEMIKDLRHRLKNHRPWTPPLEGVGFQYGFNHNQLDSWIQYWKDQYNFSEREKFFNQFPHFKTNIQGLDIHFIRVKPQVPSSVKVVPLLLMHGWPGSVREFYEAIPLLTQQTPGYDFVFEVIVPSHPGHGFSDAPSRPGLGPGENAMVLRNLMHRLGFKKFYVQGGDWGGVVAGAMVTLFPDEVLGLHSNLAYHVNPNSVLKILTGLVFPSLIGTPQETSRFYPLTNFLKEILEEYGYFHLQATKPDTIGIALTDSPAGLLAYVLEKFTFATDPEYRDRPDGGLSEKWTKDELLDNLMMYWSSTSTTSSLRRYAEMFTKEQIKLDLDSFTTPVPTWVLHTKYEFFYQPPSILRSKYTNLINVTALDVGGHYAAFELPEIFSEDVFKAVNAFRTWHQEKGRIDF